MSCDAFLAQWNRILRHIALGGDQTNAECNVGDNRLTGRVVGVIGAIGPTTGKAPGTDRVFRVRVSSMVAHGLLVKKVEPQFPDAARQAGAQGPVVLRVVVSDRCGEAVEIQTILAELPTGRNRNECVGRVSP